MSAIVVIGSLNMDFVLNVDRLPLAGETILGRNFRVIPGGKGANQAYAAAKLAGSGTKVRMLGRIGADSFGKALKANLADIGVDVGSVLETDSEASGVACIHVDDAGQNSITVAPGANGVLSSDDIDSERGALDGARCVLLQLEVPMEAVVEALRSAHGVRADPGGDFGRQGNSGARRRFSPLSNQERSHSKAEVGSLAGGRARRSGGAERSRGQGPSQAERGVSRRRIAAAGAR